VVVLAPAEAMNAVAAKTLLKMLEEPPPIVAFTYPRVAPGVRFNAGF
jgi:hypothetical protein